MSQYDTFFSVYKAELQKARTNNPELYRWNMSEFDTVYNKMVIGIMTNMFDSSSLSVKATCKVLGIKNTKKAIKAYLEVD